MHTVYLCINNVVDVAHAEITVTHTVSVLLPLTLDPLLLLLLLMLLLTISALLLLHDCGTINEVFLPAKSWSWLLSW